MDLAPAQAYRLFGSPDAGSWLFDARCEQLAVGAAVRMALPIGPAPGRPAVELLGRLCRVRPNALLAIEHAQPWRGRLTLRFEPFGPGRTRLRLRADVSPAGLEWLVRHTGGVLPVPRLEPGALRIGLVTSKSGPGAVYSMATEYLAELAVDEVNDTGGIGGRRVELVVADDATRSAPAAAEARRLVRLGCRVIFACTTSNSFSAIQRATRGDEVLLVHAVMNERGAPTDPVVRFGEYPAAQLKAMAGRLMRATGGRDWFLVGEQYSWSYGAHAAARAAVPLAAGRVIGEAYAPLGTTDFAAVIERIQRSGADIVMSSLVGSDEVEFQRQCAAAGLRSAVRSLSLVMDEPTVAHIGAAAAEGIWTAMGYFQDGPAAGNRELLARYHAAYGRWAPPLSSLSETVYEAILQYAQAVRHTPDDGAEAHRRALLGHRSGRGGTAIGARDLLRPQLFLAEARAGALRVVEQVG